MKNLELISKLREYFVNQSVMTSKEITDVLGALLPDVSTNTLSWKINQLKQEEYIFQIGRGLYSFEYKPVYEPLLSLKAKRIYNRVKPFCKTDLVIWDTHMLHEMTGVKTTKHWWFLATNKKEVKYVFDGMLDFSKQVFLQPDKEIMNRYMMPLDEAIVLNPLVTETPLVQDGEYTTMAIEAVLVDLFFHADTYLVALGYSIQELFAGAFSKYAINQSKLLRYAARRDKRNEIEELLSVI